MSEVKHTPGPWHVGKDFEAGIGRGFFVAGGKFVRANMVGPNDAQEANARLIAAAPDLLALVKLVNGSFGGGLTVTFSERDVAEFAAAIAKAEGRE